jgi:cytochrome c oxidase subunit 2
MRVVAQQFAWNIHYPGVDGIFGKVDPKLMDSSNPLGLDLNDPHAKDDVTTINQLHIPVNTPVSVMLSSKDVIHSFGIPVMRVKNDAIPGYNVPVWFQATQEGEFEIACAQLCGLGHYRMRGFFVVESKDKFNAWLAEQAPKVV